MTEYVKIIGSTDAASNVTFYINKDYADMAMNDRGAYSLLRYSEIAIDLTTNKVIKCRYPLENVFDKLLLTQPLHCDTILNNL